MIGQDKLYQKLNTYSRNNFPQSNLIIGEKGSGKHTFIKNVCDKFNLECVDMSENVDKDYINNLYLSTEKKVYIIDIIELSKKHRYLNKENALLKFIEEPPITAIVFIIVEYESQVIDTIKNRCTIWKLLPYNVEILKQFKQFKNIEIYKILNTPGKVLDSQDEEYYNDLLKLCNKIINNINRANISNTLSLYKYLGKDKYDFITFLKGIKTILYNDYVLYNIEKHLRGLELLQIYLERAHILNVNNKNLFYGFILKLKDIYD